MSRLGVNLLAFNHQLELLWQYTDEWFRYPKHSAYIPAVGDFNGDGLDEVNGGNFGLAADGTGTLEPLLRRQHGLGLGLRVGW